MTNYDHTKNLTLEAVGITQEEFDRNKEIGKIFLQDILSYKAVSEGVELIMNFLLNPMAERMKALILYTNGRYLLYHGLMSEGKESITESAYGFDHRAEKLYEALQTPKDEMLKMKKVAGTLAKRMKEESPSKIVEFFEKELLMNDQYSLKDKAIALSYLYLSIECLTQDLDKMLEGMNLALEGDTMNEGF
jgi:hypothetical protein